MKSILSIILIGFISFVNMEATINPVYKEAIQRGFEVVGDSCILPNGSKCSLIDLNEGRCGKKFMKENYCIKEGHNVWDAERCCDGLVSYLPAGVDGQATCQPKNKVIINKLFANPIVWAILGIITAMIMWMFIKMRRK